MLHLPLHQFRKNLTATLNNDPVATLSFLAEEFLGRTVFSTVFNLEDQVLTHLILTYEIPVRIFTRTGSEHLDILARTVEYYGQPIELINRQSELLAAELTDRHPEQSEAFDVNPETAPLTHVLQGSHLLVTALRRQKPGRHEQANSFEWDASGRKFNLHPLLYLTDNQLHKLIREHDIPHPLLNAAETVRPVLRVSPFRNKTQNAAAEEAFKTDFTI